MRTYTRVCTHTRVYMLQPPTPTPRGILRGGWGLEVPGPSVCEQNLKPTKNHKAKYLINMKCLVFHSPLFNSVTFRLFEYAPHHKPTGPQHHRGGWGAHTGGEGLGAVICIRICV